MEPTRAVTKLWLAFCEPITVTLAQYLGEPTKADQLSHNISYELGFGKKTFWLVTTRSKTNHEKFVFPSFNIERKTESSCITGFSTDTDYLPRQV